MNHSVKIYGTLDAEKVVDQFRVVLDNINKLNQTSLEVEIDITELNFVKPSAISMLYNITKWINDNNYTFYFKLPEINRENKVLTYLDDSQIFKITTGRSIFEDSRVRNTTLPLKNLKISSTEEWVSTTFNYWFSYQIGCEVTRLANLQSLLLELFNNTRDHSDKDYCCTYSQHYPNRKKIEISISDFGVGIPNNVKKRAPHIQSDSQRIEEALKRGFTTKTNPHNRGEGLYILNEYIVEDGIGSLMIISGNGIYKVDSSGKVVKNTLKCTYPGTFISIEIDTRKVERILTDDFSDEGVELEW
ncbi:hypothetical protein AAJL88_03090 [Staphylococcus hominis]|uniref:hypothetical protein n=1 Tax=Staphylococcus hominis TaxID=1290 RepID=UPI0031BA707C